MTTLFEKLSDLSVRVGDIEARIAAFRAAKTEGRERKISELKADFQTCFQGFENDIGAADDELSATWAEIHHSLMGKACKLKALVESKKQAANAERAELRANRLEQDAVFAIDFAAVALGEAEVAVCEAVDARLHTVEVTENGFKQETSAD